MREMTRMMTSELRVVSVSRPEAGWRIARPLYLCRVPAGFPSSAGDYVESQIDFNDWLVRNKLATYVVRVEGDSMEGEIRSGDMLIVDRSLEPRDGSIVVACVGGEMTVKRLAIEEGRCVLVTESPDYPPVEITGDTELIIWGVVTHSIRRFN